MKKLIFIIITFLIANPILSQSTYNLNGITIWESEGILYNVSPLDTARIDINFITLKYAGSADSLIIENIENEYNLNKYYPTKAGKHNI